MRIKKVINNNILCTIDNKGNEMIVTGRGIGYKRKVGEFVDTAQVEKVYRMAEKSDQRKLRELVSQVPLEHLSLTEELVEYIHSQINQPLNENLLINLADHISFAIQRKEQGIGFDNPLDSAVKCYYPTEHRLGRHCLRTIEERCGIALNQGEATFIALHIVNAALNSSMSEMRDLTRLLDGCIQVTEFYYRRKFDRDSLDFNRFSVHLRYLVQRLYQDRPLQERTTESDLLFRELIRRNCREHYECAKRIALYIESNFEKSVPEEEKIYLTIHLKRLNTADKDDESV